MRSSGLCYFKYLWANPVGHAYVQWCTFAHQRCWCLACYGLFVVIEGTVCLLEFLNRGRSGDLTITKCIY